LILLLTAFLLDFEYAEAKGRSSSKRALASESDVTALAPVDNETCFSPHEPCDVKLWKFIQSAKTTLDIAVYSITHPKIVHEILVTSKKIPTRIIVDRSQSKGTHSLVSLLIKAGADVRYGTQRGIMHHKFTLVDGARLQTGSFNYTDGATFKNQENQIYLSEVGVVTRFKHQFEEMWKTAKPAKLTVAQAKE